MTAEITYQKPNFVSGSGNPNADIMGVGMAPGQEENDDEKVWIGPAGKLMRRWMSALGYSADRMYLTNVEKYMPPNNKLALFKKIGMKPFQNLDLLRREIEAVRPKVIIGFGEHALKALTGKKGIKNWRGSILDCTLVPGTKVVCTYHPSAFLRSQSEETKSFNPSIIVAVMLDLKRAIAQSKFREFRLPQRDFEIVETYEQGRRLFDQYRLLRKVSADIETTRGTCIPTCIGFAFNRHHGFTIPLLNVGGDFRIDDHEQARLIQLVQEILDDPQMLFIGQNWKFDKKKLGRPFAFRQRYHLHHDTGMCNHILYPELPKSMQFLTSTWTEEPYYKDELAEWDPAKQSFRDILTYNCKDVCVPYEIYEKQSDELEERGLTDFFYNDIMPLSDFYLGLEERGINHDESVRERLRVEFKELEEAAQRNINAIIGYELNIGSTREVAKLLFGQFGLPTRANTKEDTLVNLLSTPVCRDNAEACIVIDDILNIRKYKRLRNGPLKVPPDYDGRQRSLCNINGASNGRTSFNILKPPERPTKVGFQAQNQSKHGDIGPEMRRMLRADPGKILVQADSSQAEARIVAALAKDAWLMSLFENKKDVHRITASWYFGKENPEDDTSPIGVTDDERFIGKTTRHALAYFCQWKRLMMTINKLARKFGIPVTVDAAEAKLYHATFLRKSPKIPEVFWHEVLEAVNKDKKKTLTAASGRTRQFFGNWDPNLYYSYIPSASVTDNTKFAAVRVNKRIPNWEILKEDHDALTFQCLPEQLSEYAAIVKEEMEKPIDLSRCSLPRDPIIIPCDIEVGPNYKDLTKWKMAS